jgi:ribosomal protein L29
MKHASYTGKTKEDLVKALYEKRESLRSFRFGEAGSKTRNVKEGSALRKEIARILTELNK